MTASFKLNTFKLRDGMTFSSAAARRLLLIDGQCTQYRLDGLSSR